MTIEKLTDQELDFLKEGIASYDDALKCLRIIDAQASALAEARDERNAWEKEALELRQAWDETRAECERFRAQAESWERGHDYAWAEKVKAEARAEALQARVAELEREVVCYDAGRDSAFDLIEQKNNELDAAHEVLETAKSELADLRGRVERAKTYLRTACEMSADALARVDLGIIRGR